MSLEKFIKSARYSPERIYIPSSLPTINALIQDVSTPRKGLRSGRMYDIVGQKSTGKTLLAYDFIKNAQAQGLKVAYADVERTFVPEWAEKNGVNLDTLTMIYADTAENNLAVVEHLTRQGYGLIVIDSVPALMPKIHNDDELDDPNAEPDYDKNKKIAALGSLLGGFVKRMIPILDYWNTTLLFINQYRANMSTMARTDKKAYEPFEYGYYLTGRLELAYLGAFEGGMDMRATVTKHKLGTLKQVGEYKIIYETGLGVEYDLLAHAVRKGIVTVPKKNYYEYAGVKAHGEKQAVAKLDFEVIKGELDAME